MTSRNSLPSIQKALTIAIWLVLFCLGLGAVSTPLPFQGASANITLAANEQIKIQAASNQMAGLSAEKKKSSAIGLAVEMGGIEGATVGVTGGKSNSKDNSISKEQIWSYSTLTAGENLNLISGGDTDILGAHLDAETINASVGGDLTIASPQNSTQHLGFGESSTTKFAIGPQVMAGGKKDNNARQITDTVKGVANAFGEDAKSLGEMVKNPSEAGFGSASISVEASLGVSKSSSTSFGVEDQSKGSSISAGGNVNLIATGKDAAGSTPEVPLKEGGSIFIQGSHITGGGDVSLIANKQIDIRAAQNSSFDMGQSKSSSGSISVSYGTQGWGGGVSASKGKGSSIEVDKSWSGSYIDAGGTATLISGGDTNIIGSQVSGDKVQAQIGGDLNIETLQDFSFSHKDEKNSGVSFSTTKGSIGGSVSHSKSNATGLHISASEYAGIMAGDGGYQIAVEGNTDLKGGIIASTQEAVNKGKNELTTGSITTSELINISTSKSEGSSISAGASFGKGGSITPSGSAGFAKESSNDLSMTLSGISGGKLTITNEEEQRARTGQSAEEAIASVNTNVKTGQSVNALEKKWDTDKLMDKMQAHTEITAAFGRESTQAVASYAQSKLKESAKLKVEASYLAKDDPRRQEMLDQAKDLESKWGDGGSYRVLGHVIMGGLGGDLSGALGAGVSAISANQLNKITEDLPPGISNIVGAGLAAGLGGLVGGDVGAASAFNEDVNNRQLFRQERLVLEELAKADAARKMGDAESCAGGTLCFAYVADACKVANSSSCSAEKKEKYWNDYYTGMYERIAYAMVSDKGEEELNVYMNMISWAAKESYANALEGTRDAVVGELNSILGDLSRVSDLLNTHPERGKIIQMPLPQVWEEVDEKGNPYLTSTLPDSGKFDDKATFPTAANDSFEFLGATQEARENDLIGYNPRDPAKQGQLDAGQLSILNTPEQFETISYPTYVLETGLHYNVDVVLFVVPGAGSLATGVISKIAMRNTAEKLLVSEIMAFGTSSQAAKTPTMIAAYTDAGLVAVGKSVGDKVTVGMLEPALVKHIETRLGSKIGGTTNLCGNFVGGCAEAMAANQLVKQGISINQIKFTRAVMPNVVFKQGRITFDSIVSICSNCVKVFGH